MFHKSDADGVVHVVSHSENVVRVEFDSHGQQHFAYINDDMGAAVGLSTGAVVLIGRGEEPPWLEFAPWSLTVKSWVPGPEEEDTHSVIKTINLGQQDNLLPWSEIPQVQSASGVGINTTTLSVPTGEGVFSLYDTAVIVNSGRAMGPIRA